MLKPRSVTDNISDNIDPDLPGYRQYHLACLLQMFVDRWGITHSYSFCG